MNIQEVRNRGFSFLSLKADFVEKDSIFLSYKNSQ